MKMRNLRATQNSWGLIAKIFHWLLAILLIWQIFTGLNLHNMEFSPTKIVLIEFHKTGKTKLSENHSSFQML